jgi:FkbM family methyltransferase
VGIFDLYKKYKISYENPISVLWSLYRRKEQIPVILKKDHEKRMFPQGWVTDYASIIELFPEKANKLKEFYDSIQVLDHSDRNKVDDYVEFEYKNHQCKFYGIVENGRIVNGDIVHVFFKEDYKFLNFENSTIIDIGANIGDTAIYFCLNNAKRVIALEPFPYSYKYALLNITSNNMNDKIEIINAGYGHDSEVNVKDKKSNGSSLLETSDNGIKINIYSLETLLKKYNFNDNNNLLLKMDCEGCEYNLLEESIDMLRKFKRIEIEFHYGYRNLESKLKESGFSVHHGKFSKSDGSDSSLKKMAVSNRDLTLGIIYAERHSV